MTKRQFSRTSGLALVVALIALLIGASAAHAKPAFAHFDADTKKHSWANSYLLAIASNYAYRANVKKENGNGWKAKFDHAFSRYGLDVIAFIDKRQGTADTQIVVARRKGLIVVAFAGSESLLSIAGLKDWIATDLRVRLERPTWFTDIKLHAGFSKALDVAYPRLVKVLKAHRHPSDRLWITGHSLGGSLATIAAFRLHRDGHRVDGVATYGAPKAGNGKWKKAYAPLERRTSRWVHGLDPVPRVPPWPYRAVGTTHVIRTGGKVELRSNQRAIAVPMPTTHSISMYIDRIRDNMPKKLRKKLPIPPKKADKERKKRERKKRKKARKKARKNKR